MGWAALRHTRSTIFSDLDFSSTPAHQNFPPQIDPPPPPRPALRPGGCSTLPPELDFL
jgi:hypothetical protein